MRQESALALDASECAGFAAELERLCDKLEAVVAAVRERAGEDVEYPYRVAGDFLRLCGVALLGFAWVRGARVSRLLPDSDPVRASKLQTAQFFFAYVLPEADYRIASIRGAMARLAFVE